MVVRIADFNISFQRQFDYVGFMCKEYRVFGVEPEVEFILKQEKNSDDEDADFTPENLENLNLLRQFADWLIPRGAFVLHSATFDVDGVGIAFAAHSGTGKTTHMNLWQKFLGNRMTVVNGDKPIVRFFSETEAENYGVISNIPYAYGTPWCGKENLGCNMRTPLKHICFIERSPDNYVTKIEKSDAIDRMMNQVYMPKNPTAVLATMQLIDRLLASCQLWVIHCNMEADAASTAYHAIFGENDFE